MTTKQPTVGDIFYTIKTVRKDLEKLGYLSEENIEMLVSKRKENIKAHFPELYAEFEKRVGCFTTEPENNEYGFKEYEVVTDIGGHYTLVDYRTNADERVGDLGCTHRMSPYGIGGSEYVRPEGRNVQELIDSVYRTVWMNKDEKEYLVNALETFR